MTISFLVCACSSAPDEPPPVSIAAPISVCPVDLASMTGKSCRNDLRCTALFPCGASMQQARCACGDDGLFACEDSTGPIRPGDEPRCASLAGADATPCPVSLSAAAGARCATLGRFCFYKGAVCTNPARQLLDACQCHGALDGTLAYECRAFACAPFAIE